MCLQEHELHQVEQQLPGYRPTTQASKALDDSLKLALARPTVPEKTLALSLGLLQARAASLRESAVRAALPLGRRFEGRRLLPGLLSQGLGD